jgi:PKD repeat protein
LSSFSSLYLDDVIFEAIPACIPPNNPILNSVGTTTANVSFGAGGANLYNYNWGPCGFTPGTGVFVSGQTGTSYTATGLAPGSCYDLYIQTDCGVAGTSPWVGPLTFTTLCLPNAMPYLEDFTTWPPACFQLVNGGLDWQHDPTGYATVQFWNGNGQAKMITKSVFISQQAQVSFLWAKQYSQFSPNEALTLRAQVVGNTSWDTLVHLSGPSFNSPNAGYFTPPASKSDFVSELTFLDSATYVGQTVVFELIGQADYGPWPFVDDFAVEVIPACPKPTAVLASNITQTTVNLAWTSNAPGSSWQISYGPPSGTAATGTKVSVPTNPFTLTGLSPSTSYCVYVREICGPGDTSIWSTVNCFTTACGPVSLPYVEDFSANALSTCWGNFNLSGDTQTNSFWRNTSSFWPNYAAQGVIDHTGNGGFAMGVDGSFPYPLNDIIMETPELIFTGVPSPELSFWMFSSVAGFGTAADLNELYVDFYNGTTWNNGIYYFKGDSASWFKITVPLSAYPVSGGNAKIRFRVNKIGVTAFYNDIIVDDISVASGSSCPPPTAVAPSNIGCDVMDVTFVSGSGTSQLEYGPAGFTPGTGTVINPATSPVSISGLTPGTNYQVYVSDLCGGVPSPAAGPIAVTTASGPLPSGAFTYTVTSTGATFNASASTGGTTYTWDYGNNTTGTGVNPSATFAANGNYTVTLIVGNACGNDTLTQNVFINIGLDDLQLSNSFKAWPNPTQGLLNVEFALGSGNATLEVLDLTGRVLMTEQFTAQGLTKKELNLANYAKGVYLVRVSSGAASATRKITLQ